jgi:hypothetical protein
MVQIARIKVTLKGIRPPIWRRLEVLVARCPFFDPKQSDLAAAGSTAARDSTELLSQSRMSGDDSRHPAHRHGRLLRLGGT